MKKTSALFYTALLAILFFAAGCKDANVVVDQNTEISNHNWTYLNHVNFPVRVDDEKQAYNLYMNLRVTGDYKYANLFVLISQTGPDKKVKTKRYELTLAAKDGEWYGKGSGNLYAYQLPFLTNYKFPVKGTYTFSIEQNMRDNPLREVSDVGIKLEKAK